MTDTPTRRWWPKLPPEWIQLPVTPLKTALALLLYADDETGSCWPSQERLAADAGLGLRSIQSGIAYLRAAGLISVRYRKAKTAVYTLNLRHSAPIPKTPTYAEVQAALRDLERGADAAPAATRQQDPQNPAELGSRPAESCAQDPQNPADRTSQRTSQITTSTAACERPTPEPSPMVTRLMNRIAAMPERMAVVEFFTQLPNAQNPDTWAGLIVGCLDGLGFDASVKVHPPHVAAACLDFPIVAKEPAAWTPAHFRACVAQAARQGKGAAWGGKAPAWTPSGRERASADAAERFISGD